MFVSQIFDEASETLGTTDQSKVFRKLTQAVQALMESGHWFHTQAEVDVCTGWDGYTLTLPRGIEVPLGVNIDGSPLYFRGRLFQYHVNKGGMYNTVEWAWDDRGFVATQMDIRQPSQLVAVAESDADVGKTLRVVGTNQWNRDLRSQLPDGTGVDGLLVQIHSQSDFNLGTITPDGNTVVTRSAAVTPLNQFVSTSAHQLSSGQPVVLTSATGTVPSGLTVSNQYFVGVVNPTTIQLYTDPLYAQKGEYPIDLTSILGAGTLTLTDRLNANLVTAINLSTAPKVSLNIGNEVVFFGSSLPAPLAAGITYFANLIDSTNLQIYASLSDAQNQTNQIYLSGSNSSFNIQLRKAVAPITELITNIPHLFATGDIVQAYTNGGTLPQPLVSAQNYYVQVLDSSTIILHTSVADAFSGNNPISLTTSGSGQNTLNKLIPATATVGNSMQITAPGFVLPTATGAGATATAVVSGVVTSLSLTNAGTGYTSTPTVSIDGGGGTGATATAVIGTVSGSPQYGTIIALILNTPGSGYVANPTVTITGGSGSNATATATITAGFVTSYVVTNGGAGYNVPPSVQFPTPSPGQTVPVATAVISNGSVTSITVVSQGTGYTSAPAVTLVPSTGVLVSFSSTGTLPAPLQEGATYRAEAPASAGGTFTLVNDDYTPLTLTSVGSGTLYLTISRSFSVGFTDVWYGDFSTITSGSTVYFGSDYLLPVTSPPIDNGVTPFYVKPLSSTTAKFYSDVALTNLIKVNQLGTGQTYYAVQQIATPVVYNNLVYLSSQQYLTNGTVVQFSSTGTLPSPLTASTNYTIKLVGVDVQVYDSTNSLVNFTSFASGQLYLNIVRNFTPVSPNTITLANAIFDTGTSVIPRPTAGDILDPNLISGTTYYTRFVDASTIALYATKSQSLSLSSTSGLITLSTVGNTNASTFFLDAVEDPTFAKAIFHIEKPITQGYVSLYACDYGRSNDMALIGQYHPTEVNPKYRRIRVGKPCAWARIIYRVKAPTISSTQDYIPVEQDRAILAAVHAIDLEDKDFAEQAVKYWELAFRYLKNQQTSMDGHAMEPIQVNGLTYGDRTDPIIDSSYGGY